MSNSDEDIRIEFTALEPGWQIKGNKVKVKYVMLCIRVLKNHYVTTDLPDRSTTG